MFVFQILFKFIQHFVALIIHNEADLDDSFTLLVAHVWIQQSNTGHTLEVT